MRTSKVRSDCSELGWSSPHCSVYTSPAARDDASLASTGNICSADMVAGSVQQRLSKRALVVASTGNLDCDCDWMRKCISRTHARTHARTHTTRHYCPVDWAARAADFPSAHHCTPAETPPARSRQGLRGAGGGGARWGGGGGGAPGVHTWDRPPAPTASLMMGLSSTTTIRCGVCPFCADTLSATPSAVGAGSLR